jgi:CRP/FNR family cyclic AMP-dependent transcriptional regulator
MPDSILRRVPLFADLSDSEIAALSSAFRRRRYTKGTLIHASGAMGADLYVIESGPVTITLPSEHGQELTLALLGPGDFFGETSLIDEEPWYADAIAVADTMLLLLGKRDFIELLERRPKVMRRLLTIVSRRLRHNARFAQDLAFLDVPTRLAQALVTLVESTGWGWSGEGERPLTRVIDITQSALAAHVGATRESINKWLGYYERRGYIRRMRDRIEILSLDELRPQR